MRDGRWEIGRWDGLGELLGLSGFLKGLVGNGVEEGGRKTVEEGCEERVLRKGVKTRYLQDRY